MGTGVTHSKNSNKFTQQLGWSSSDTNHDPTLGPWNTVQCRTNTYLIFPLTEQNPNGVVVAFDIFPISGGTLPETIFALRNSITNGVTLTLELGFDRMVRVWQNLPGVINSWTHIVTSAGALTDSNL